MQQAILLNPGRARLAAALATGAKLRPIAWRLGEAANFEPDPEGIDVIPAVLHQGDATQVKTGVIDTNRIRFEITVGENVGSFLVGNVMLFVDDGFGGLVPFLWAVSPVQVPKVVQSPNTIGNRIIFNLVGEFANISTGFNVTIVTEQYAGLPNYDDEYALPLAEEAVYQQGVLQYNHKTFSPAIVARREADNSWYVLPHFQRLDDPEYGYISGGIVTDGYKPYLGSFAAAGNYRSPAAEYTETKDGGAAWAPSIGGVEFSLDGGGY